LALDEILSTIRAEAEKTASAVVSAARAEAREVLDRASARAEDERRRLAASLDDRARQEQSRIISRAHLETAKERRAAREKTYQSALEGVRRRLEAIRASPRYEEILGSLLDEAMAALPDAGVINVDPEDLDLVEELLSSRGLHLDVEAESTPLGGLKLIADGRDVDNTLATRLRRADTHLRFIAGELVPGLRGVTP
jgi:V/A-type H+-transporting ATPase subunit E